MYIFRRLIGLFIIIILFSSCAHKVLRDGYEIKQFNSHSQTESVDSINCKLKVVKYESILMKGENLLGKVEIKDNGFSVNCQEGVALNILKREACILGANIIHIYEEYYPDAKSTCYRCKAEFYLVEENLFVNLPEEELSPDILKQNAEMAKKKVRSQLIGAIIGGVVGGILGGLLAMQISP